MGVRDNKVRTFREMHGSGCFVVPNPWDPLSARLLDHCGFKALATTSSGYAFSIGRKDNARQVSRDESLAYAESIVRVTTLPVTADLEDCYAETVDDVAETVRLAAEAGLAGLSIEDRSPLGPEPFHSFEVALERVAAASDAARRHDIVLTARADGLGKRYYDASETVRRLIAYEKVGAEVVYAPGIPDLPTLRAICAALSAPFNHVLGQGVRGLSVEQIALAGVRRISLGGAFTRAACAAVKTVGQNVASGDFSAIDAAPTWSDL